MPLECNVATPDILIVHATGKLVAADYDDFIPVVDRLVREQGKISLLFDMQDFHGWELAAMWEDAKFGLHHLRDIKRLAILGEKPWQKTMTSVCKAFTRAEVRYFTQQERAECMEWLNGPPPAR